MSGIAGLYALDGRPAEPESLHAMLRWVAHRGPDDVGTWLNGPVALGHHMLWTTPEALHERQPLLSADGRLCLTADARVDNRAELRAALASRGFLPRDDTDAELILQAYECWGEACPEQILGDFAFVLWDGRQSRLIAVTDPLGIKPFYYHSDGATFRWASLPSAIFADGGVPRKPNRKRILLYLLRQMHDLEETLDQDVYRLPPGHCLIVTANGARKAPWWSIDPAREIRYKTDAEYAEHFLHLFRDAVAVRLRSHRAVGATLSGGVDSSSIVCLAQNLSAEGMGAPNGFEAFSQVFPGQACDESAYIDEVAALGSLTLNRLTFDSEAVHWVDFEQVRSYPDVYYLPTLYLLGQVFRAAQQKGIRSLHWGVGGDELLAPGYDCLTDLWRQRRLRQLRRSLGQYASGAAGQAGLFVRYCLKPSVPALLKSGIKTILRPFRADPVPPWIDRGALEETGAGELLRRRPPDPAFPRATQQALHDHLYGGWLNLALALQERFLGYFQIEPRYPYFDRRLIEFAFAVPVEQLGDAETSKKVLRRSMQGVLPEKIRNRKDKASFSCIVDGEFRKRQAAQVTALLRTSRLASLGVVNRGGLEVLYGQCSRDPVPEVLFRSLHDVLWLELWTRTAAA